MISSSSTTSSTVGRWVSSAACFSINFWAGVNPSGAEALPLLVASEAILLLLLL
jgi:hypothetical protein